MKIGFVIPLAIVSVILLSISSGLYSILGPDSPTGWWVGFQIMAGVGSGLGLNLVCLFFTQVLPCTLIELHSLGH